VATVKLPVIGTTDRRWVFGAGALVAVVVAYAYWRRSSAPAAGDPVEAVYDPSQGGVAAYSNPAPNAPESGEYQPDDGQTLSGHEQWSRDALAGLAETGQWEPGYLAVVIGKYLQGVPLTAAERDVILAAYAVAGYPQPMLPIVLIQSQPAPGGGGGPKPPEPPPATPAPKKAKRRYVVVDKYTTKNAPWNSTVSGIAGRSGRTVGQIDDWNSAVSGPKYIIHPGQQIWIDPPGDYSGSVQWKG